MRDDPILWITDFGLSGNAAGPRTQQATFITERPYIRAPELYSYFQDPQPGEQTTEEQVMMQMADVFSFGVVVYYVCKYFISASYN